jgi:hypothetical protein
LLFKHFTVATCKLRAGIVQSVKRLAMGWLFRGSNPGGGYFPHPSRPTPGPTQPPGKWLLVPVPGVKRSECGVDHPPHQESTLKKEYYYSEPSWPVVG